LLSYVTRKSVITLREQPARPKLAGHLIWSSAAQSVMIRTILGHGLEARTNSLARWNGPNYWTTLSGCISLAGKMRF
jgi:hypothetical protein